MAEMNMLLITIMLLEGLYGLDGSWQTSSGSVKQD